MNVNISKMKKENIADVAEIEKSCFSKPWSILAIEAELENPNAHFYVLSVEDGTADDKIVGYGGMHIILDEAYIANIADMLGIRVSRRIKGKYVYTINDLKEGKSFENPVVISNYPVDVHSNRKDNSVLEILLLKSSILIIFPLVKSLFNFFIFSFKTISSSNSSSAYFI